jgi:hypothetical protein
VIETLIVIGGLVGLVKGLSGGWGGGIAKSPDECDRHEAQFLRDCGRDGTLVSRNYLDAKRSSLGFPRRAGVNADLLSKFADRGGE